MYLCKYYTSAFGERQELCRKEFGTESEEDALLTARADTIKLVAIINQQMKSQNPRWTNLSPGDIEVNLLWVDPQLDIFAAAGSGLADQIQAASNRVRMALARIEYGLPRNVEPWTNRQLPS